MNGEVRDVLAGIGTVGETVVAFAEEGRCRRLLEAMIWPRGRLCPRLWMPRVDGHCRA